MVDGVSVNPVTKSPNQGPIVANEEDEKLTKDK